MANKGRFVEDVATTSSDFTSASRGQISDRSLGTLFSGVGKTVSGAIEVADNQFKESIQNKVDAFYEDQTSDQDPAIMEFASEGVPQELTSGTDNIVKMSRAYGKGLISDTQFFMRASALAKRLKSQYPGHREYVDAAINKARGTSANVARQSLLREIDALTTAETKQTQDLVKTNRKLLQGGFLTPAEFESSTPERAFQIGSAREFEFNSIKNSTETLKRGVEAGNITQQEAAEKYAGLLPQLIQQPMNMVLGRALNLKNGGSFKDLVSALDNVDFDQMDPEAKAQLFQGGNQLIGQIRTQVLNSPTYASLDEKGKSFVNTELDRQLEHIEQALRNKDWDAIKGSMEALTIETDEIGRRQILRYGLQDLMGTRAALDRALPKGSVEHAALETSLLQRWDHQSSKLVSEGNLGSILNGEKTVAQIMEQVVTDPVMSPEDKVRSMVVALDTSNNILKSRSPTDPLFEQTARALFVDNPQRILSLWDSQEDRLQVFHRFLNTDVATKIMQANPQISQAFETWVASSFGNVTVSEFGDINRVADRFVSDTYVNPNERDTFRIVAEPSEGRFSLRLPLNRDLTSAERQAIESTKKVNSLLDKIMPVLQHNHKSVAQAWEQLIIHTPFRDPKDPWMKSLMGVLQQIYSGELAKDAPPVEGQTP